MRSTVSHDQKWPYRFFAAHARCGAVDVDELLRRSTWHTALTRTTNEPIASDGQRRNQGRQRQDLTARRQRLPHGRNMRWQYRNGLLLIGQQGEEIQFGRFSAELL